MQPFRVFCGWDERQTEAAEVFKYSVEQNASCPVDVRFLKIDDLPISRVGATAFTYSRFLVPWLCDFAGKAVFFDGCDMLCQGDVAELRRQPLRHALYVVRHAPLRQVPRDRPRSWTSMMLFDCRQFGRWSPAYVDSKATLDDALMRLRVYRDSEIGTLPDEWNHLVDVGADPEPAVKVAHWSALADPNIGPWVDASGSAVWADWRDRWRWSLRPPREAAAQAGQEAAPE